MVTRPFETWKRKGDGDGRGSGSGFEKSSGIIESG